MESLRGVRRIEGTLTITGAVNDLSPLACLRDVTGDVSVYDAETLADLTGLEHLTTVGGNLHVGYHCWGSRRPCVGNPALRNLDALRSLESATEVIISPACFGEGNDQDCAPSVLERVVLEGLREVETLYVRLNPALVEARFDALERVSTVRFIGLFALRSIRFPSLVRVEDMGLWGAQSLEDIAFPSLTSAGSISLEATGLSDLVGFQPLSDLEGFRLWLNSRLVSLNGLDLASLQRLKIEFNDSLTTLSGLNTLTDIEEYLWIDGNAGLASLDGTENLERVGQQLVISNNPVLPTCEAERLLDRVGTPNVGGTVSIHDNDDSGTCQ